MSETPTHDARIDDPAQVPLLLGEGSAAAPPRPSLEDYARAACLATAEALVAHEAALGPTPELVESLLRLFAHDHYSDGYRLARILDDRAGWRCDMETALVLDEHAGQVFDAQCAAERAWAARWNIRPPLAIGTRVRLRQRLRKEDVGTITGTDAQARYLVRIDGDASAEPPTNARRLVNFEAVEPLLALVPAEGSAA